MTPKQLLAQIEAHLKRSGELAYPFGLRVLGDKTFVWKLRNSDRKPTVDTINTVMAACNASRPKKKRKRRGKKAKKA